MPKPDIHPTLHDTTIECACGNVMVTKSARPSYKVDICSSCHPFFTGKQKLIDTEGRVQRFHRKYKRAT